MTTSAEVPIFQWGRRSGPSSGVCNGAYLSVGSQPSYGAGGFFGSGCDVSYGATNTTEIGVGGSRPRINEWHHVVLTYTGIQPQPNMGVQANTWTLYVDGVVSRQGSNILNILRGDIGGDMMTVGSYIGTTGAWGITTTGLLIGQIRMHEQMLGPDDVAFNYALDAPLYRPGAASTASGVQLIPTPSSSPSPGAGSCPAAWSGVTHFLRGLSLQSANDTTGYMRHACYNMYVTPAFPVTDLTSVGDATQIVRPSIDGFTGAVSLQSANFPDRYMAPLADGYLFYDLWATMVNNRSRGAWVVSPQPDGSAILVSRAPGFVGWYVSLLSAAGQTSARVCTGRNTNLRVYAPGSGVPPQRFFVSDPLQSLNAMPVAITQQYRSERVVLEAVAAPNSFIASCGGSLITQDFNGVQNPAAPFTLVPPLACGAVCGSNAFSLLAGSSLRYLFVIPSGGLKVALSTDPDFTVQGASFIATRATVNGQTGWVISSANGYASGMVLTRGEAGSCAVDGCCVASTTPAALSIAPVPAGGLALAHLFKMSWEDGAGELTAMPATSFAAPACGASSSPVPSATATGSLTSSATPSPSSTASNTPSASATQVLSFSASPSPDSATATPPPTTSGTTSATPSATATATPSSTPYYRIGGRLWIDLKASDFTFGEGGLPVWDNQATAGPVAPTNGDFVGYGLGAIGGVNASLTWPSYAVIDGVPAVVFNVSADGVADRLYANHSSFPGSGSFYSQSDWTLEGWVWTDALAGATGGSENAWFQWGTRPGLSCNVANIGISHNSVYGAGGHWGGGCDVAFSGPLGNAATEQIAGSGWMPRRGQWHHIALTYTGSVGVPMFQQRLYVDGELTSQYDARQLVIAKVAQLHIGAFLNSAGGVDTPGRIAVSKIRLHDSALSGADVWYNYLTEGTLYRATPSTTATGTRTPSTTSSSTATPTASLTSSVTPTGTQLFSFSPTATPTSTPPVRIAGSLLVDLRASDFALDASGVPTWDNRMSAGPLSFNNGDFVAIGPNTSYPSFRVIAGQPAVVFNASADGVLDRMESNNTWFPNGMFGSSDWSFEAWVFQAQTPAASAENPIMQWGPRSAANCQSAFTSIGSHPTWGAGGHFNCDTPWGEHPFTTLIGTGYAPRAGMWHHAVWTFSGPTGVPANALTVWLDGTISTVIGSRALNILRPSRLIMGGYVTTADVYSTGSNLAISRIRIHDGAMTAADVQYNFNQETAAYIPTPSNTASNTPSPSPSNFESWSPTASLTATPSNSPTPSNTPSGSVCPTFFVNSHVHRAASFQLASDPTGATFVRHACYWLFGSPNFPVTNQVASGDATQIVRLALDGTADGVSFESSNYPGRYMAVSPTGYVFYNTTATLNLTPAGRASATWMVQPQPDGTVSLLNRWTGLPMTFLNGTSANTCSGGYGPNMVSGAPGISGAVAFFSIVDPLAPPASYSTVDRISQNVVVESLSGAGGLFAQSCGGSVVLRGDGLLSSSTAWGLAPPVGCPSTCAGQTLSLRSGGATLSFPNAETGSVSVSGSFTPESASLVATRATIDGASGWVFSTVRDFASGLVVTARAATGTGACYTGAATVRELTLAPIPAGGLTRDHLFRVFWADGSGNVNTVPGTPLVNGQAACAFAPSTSPLPTASPSPGSLTASSTASPTSSFGASASASPSTTATGTPTPSSTPLFRVAGRLLVELRANDLYFNESDGAPIWPNRAALNPALTLANGHFLSTGAPATWPTYAAAFGPTGVSAVSFLGTSDGTAADYMEAGFAAFPSTAIYGQSDWSIEMWVAPSEWQVNGESPVFQWGGRPGTSCNSGYLGVGSSPTNGAGGHWQCEMTYAGPGRYVTMPQGSTGYRPIPGMFHHIVVTYTGASSDTPFIETLYLNGAVNRVYTNRQLAIPRTVNMRLGTWVGSDVVGQFALANLRVHDGVLTAGDVAANFAQDAAGFIATPTPTSSVTPSSSSTASSSTTGTTTQILTPSSTQTPSQTRTGSTTPSATPVYAIATRVLIDLHAADYNDATGAWDNRATAGALSAANGDFLPNPGATAASWPFKEARGGLTAVVFNAARAGVPQRLEALTTSFSQSTIYGTSDWSFEAWVWADAIFAENPIFQWGPRNAAACSGANIGAGSSPGFGAAAFWQCDSPFGNATSGELTAVPGSGSAPSVGRWHHIAVTYTGTSGLPSFLNRIYLNGVLSTEVQNRVLNIARSVPLAVGSWTPANVSSNIAVHRLRMHDGCLTPAQVLSNFLTEGEFTQILPTPLSTPSNSATSSNTPSSSTTASNTASASATRSSTGTATQTRSATATTTQTSSSSQTGTGTASPSQTASGTRTPSLTPTVSRTAPPTRTSTASVTASRTVTPTSSETPTGSVSATSSETASVSSSQTGTPSASGTQTGTPSASGTQTGTASASATETGTPSSSATETGSSSPSQTGTATGSPSPSQTGTAASTQTPSLSSTGTPASTSTRTPAASGTATKTRVSLPSATPTRTRTRTATRTRTKTKTKTKTRTPSKKKKLMA